MTISSPSACSNARTVNKSFGQLHKDRNILFTIPTTTTTSLRDIVVERRPWRHRATRLPRYIAVAPGTCSRSCSHPGPPIAVPFKNLGRLRRHRTTGHGAIGTSEVLYGGFSGGSPARSTAIPIAQSESMVWLALDLVPGLPGDFPHPLHHVFLHQP